MTNRMLMIQVLAVLFAAGLLAAGPSVAGKPEWAGKGKKSGDDVSESVGKFFGGGKDAKKEHGKSSGKGGREVHFGERDRDVIRDYFRVSYDGGACPPGLAKKNNGCMPPGQAKKRWSVGHRLPDDLVVYDLPDRVVIDLGRPPVGHKYVRAAADILLIAVGTGMVVDAIEDLANL